MFPLFTATIMWKLPSDTESLREILEGLTEIAVIYANRLAELKIGPITERVASFGYYNPKEGRDQIEEVARMICQCGKVGLTLNAFYLPNTCDVGHPIDEIIPDYVRRLFTRLKRDDWYITILPRIVSKAVLNFTVLRTQLIEWFLCDKNNVPCLCFIICDEIEGKKNDCPYLSVAPSLSYSECTNDRGPSFCMGYTGRVFCPFTKRKRIPWVVIQATIRDYPRSRLVAVKQLSNLKDPLHKFLAI